MPKPKELFELVHKNINVIVSVVTDQCRLKSRIGPSDEVECRLCSQDKETVEHIFFPVSVRITYATFGKVDHSSEDLNTISFNKISKSYKIKCCTIWT